MKYTRNQPVYISQPVYILKPVDIFQKTPNTTYFNILISINTTLPPSPFSLRISLKKYYYYIPTITLIT